ncbi:hypothetical protein D3C76_1346420 [compost metagenome]
MHQVVTQLHILEQYLPRFARLLDGLLFWRGLGGGWFGLFLRRGLGRLAGEQLLPVELAVLFQRGPGFQFFATDLAHGDQLLDQVDRGFAHFQAGQACQRAAIRGLDGERCNAHRRVVQQ